MAPVPPVAQAAPAPQAAPASVNEAAAVAANTHIVSNNRLGMRKSRDLSNQAELDRIVAAEQKENAEANGDIILQPTPAPNKKKKLFVVLGVVAAVVCVAMTVAAGFLVVSNNSHSATDDFVDWLLNGDGSISLDDEEYGTNVKLGDFEGNDKMIYPLNFYNANRYNSVKDESIESYFTELNARFENLKNGVTEPDKMVKIEKIEKWLRLIENNVNYMKIEGQILSNYDEYGECTIANCYQSFDVDMGDEEQNDLLKKQKVFYEGLVRRDLIYKSVDCFNERTSGDYACVMSEKYELTDALDMESDKVKESFEEIVSYNSLINEGILETIKQVKE